MPTPLKWTYEKCKEEALKYTSRSGFQKKSRPAYVKAVRKNWLKSICNHMVYSIKPSNHWNFENCKLEALKYSTRTEFNKKSNGAYRASRENKWLDDICNHMLLLGNKHKRFIYSFEFPDNHVYVGLTLNINKRKEEHLNGSTKSSVFDYIQKTNLKPTLKILTNEPVSIKEATVLENVHIKKYKELGWILLNRIKGGGLGGNNQIWTFDRCKKEALKYNYRHEFKKNSNAYKPAQSNGWLDDICSHMIKKHNTLTKDFCLNQATKYESRLEFQKNSKSAYEKSRINKWLDEFYPTI